MNNGFYSTVFSDTQKNTLALNQTRVKDFSKRTGESFTAAGQNKTNGNMWGLCA
jgi:hypothetical protein